MNFYRLGKTLLLAGALTFLLQGCAQLSRISYLAKDEKNLTEVSDAIDKGADIDSCKDGSLAAGTALINASVAGNEKMVSMLVKKGARLTKGCWTIYGLLQPPLTEASARGHLGVMHILLSHGANPRSYSISESNKGADQTPIWAATKANQYAAVKALLTYDESLALSGVRFDESMGRISELGTILPVHYAVYKGYDEVAALLSLSSSGHMRTSNGYGLDDVIKKREMHIAEAERTAERDRENSRKDNAFGMALGMATLGVGVGLDGRAAGNLGIAAGRDYRDGTTSNTASFMTNTAAKMRDFNAQVERERQAKSLQDQQRLKKPTLYQQQLNRIAKSNGTDNNKRQVRNSLTTAPVINRPSVSVSTNIYSDGSKSSNRSNSELANNNPRVSESSSCSPAYTTPSFTVEGKNVGPRNSVGGKVSAYMRKTCGSDKPSYNKNPDIQCTVLEKIKSKYFSNLTRERCTSEPLTFTCCANSSPRSGSAM